MPTRKTSADYSVFNTGRSYVNPRTEAAIAEQTGTPLYGQVPQAHMTSPGINPYMPNDPRLSGQGPSLLDILLMLGRHAMKNPTFGDRESTFLK